MAERLTPDELSALLARHATDERWRRSGHAPDPHGAHADRGALLDLARRVAECFHDGDGLYREDCCQFCGALVSLDRAADHRDGCPAPLLEVLHG